MCDHENGNKCALIPDHAQLRTENAGLTVQVLVAERHAKVNLCAAPHGAFQSLWTVGFVFADAEAWFGDEHVHQEGCSSTGVRIVKQVWSWKVFCYLIVQLVGQSIEGTVCLIMFEVV